MMKIILLTVFFYSSASYGCGAFIATSEISKAIALQPNAGAKACAPSDPCVCIDGIDWRAAVFSNGLLSNDPAKLSAAQAADQALKTAANQASADRQARITQIQSAISNWATLTAAQKDAILKMVLQQLSN